VLKGCCGDHQLVAAYQSQPHAETLLSSRSPQEFAAAIEQMAHLAIIGLLEDFIQREAAHAIINGVKDWEVKQQLLVSSERSLH
jgi:hypothetical protein